MKAKIPWLWLQYILSCLSSILPFILSLFCIHREVCLYLYLSLTKSVSNFQTTKTEIHGNGISLLPWHHFYEIYSAYNFSLLRKDTLSYGFRYFLPLTPELCCWDSPPIFAENPLSLTP